MTNKPPTFNGDLTNLPVVLQPLMVKPNWVMWCWELGKEDWTKVPYQFNGRKASTKNPKTWGSHAAGVASFGNGGSFDGIGFCLRGSGINAFDVDKCRDPVTGVLKIQARKLLERCGSYAEITPSGTGIRILGLSSGGVERHKKYSVGDGVSVEIYRDATRYITVTGLPLDGYDKPLLNIDEVIDEVYAECEAHRGSGGDQTITGSFTNDQLPQRVASMLSIRGQGAYPSRSELLFAFLCEAIRAKVSDEAIIEACLDDQYSGGGISQHIQEQGGDHHSYLLRQMASAKKKFKTASADMPTDLGNARRLVRQRGEDIRYVHDWKSWLVWEDGHWRRDNNAAVMRMAKATVEEMFVEAARINDEATRVAFRKHALGSQHAQRLAGMMKLAESEIEVVLPVDQIDADPYLLSVQNGVVDLHSGKFRDARREDYLIKQAGVRFDATASCPKWIEFLDKIFLGKGDVIGYVQRYAGYLLTGLTVEEVVVIMWGGGSNGKSTFRETLFALMGDYAIASDSSLLMADNKNKTGGAASPEVARLHGRRMVTVNETEQNAKMNVERMKYITGGHDTMSARNLYESLFDFKPTHKPLVTTNHKPIIRSNDLGTWRRIHLLAFLYLFSEQKDPNFLKEALLPELSGVLNWAIEGLLAYRQQGLNPSPAVLEATKDYRTDMDFVGRWIAERCVVETGAKERSANLFYDYESWSRLETGFTLSKSNFYRDLEDRGFPRAKSDGEMWCKGLRLVPVAGSEASPIPF